MAKKNEPKVNLVEVLKEVMDAKNMDDSVIEGALRLPGLRPEHDRRGSRGDGRRLHACCRGPGI